jgi:hypothetical protein
MLGGTTPPDAEPAGVPETEDVPAEVPAPGDAVESEPRPAPAKGRGTGTGLAKGGRTGGVKGKQVRAHTIYLPQDLYQRVWLTADRKDMTLSEYVAWALDRQVPKYRLTADGSDA